MKFVAHQFGRGRADENIDAVNARETLPGAKPD